MTETAVRLCQRHDHCQSETDLSAQRLPKQSQLRRLVHRKSGGTRITTDTVFSANTTVYAHWTYIGGGSSGYSYYTIKATAGAGGSISPSGNVSVREGRDQTFTITPDTGYTVSDVRIDGNSVGAVESYTFENVGRTHTIEVIFMKANGNPQTGVFVDVAAGVYYEDAVDWAVESGITKGTDDTHFYPDGICTRAHAVTFLWRTAGSPEPETRAMPFADVPVGSYYYDAVLWAVENGITRAPATPRSAPT
ncbi:MAG: S-layer homology domain-containing protein [Eubacteriales bacterium]